MSCEEVREALASGEDVPEAHLAACPSCREAQAGFRLVLEGLVRDAGAPSAALDAAVLRSAEAGQGRRERFSYARVAALLLAACGFAAWSLIPARPGKPGLASLPLPAPSGGIDVRALGPSSHLELGPGACVQSLPGAHALTGGRLYARIGGGNPPFRLSLPSAELVVLKASFEACVGMPVPPVASLLSSAWAGEDPPVEILVESGSVEVRARGRVWTLPAGALLTLRSGEEPVLKRLEAGPLAARLVWREGPSAPRDLLADGEGSWELSGPGRVAWGAGQLLIDAPEPLPFRMRRTAALPGRFLWTLRFRARKGGHLEIPLPEAVGGQDALVLAELPQLSDGREHTLTLRWDMAPALLLDGVPIRSLPRPTGGSSAGALGLGVTRGELEILAWQWKPLP